MALLGLMGCITPTMLYAQEAAPAQDPRDQRPVAEQPASGGGEADLDTEVEGIVVTAGQRQFGAVVGDIQPETTFSAADVRSLGVSSVTEMLSELSAQTASAGGGAPVVLLNGRRISGMGEIRDIPTEAIQRVEILPEEVALKYGYTADQKVVNVVLRQRFRGRTGEISLAAPTDGGQTTEQFESSTLRLNRQGRLNTSFKYAHSDKLLESDRDIISRAAGGGYGLRGNITSVDRGGEIDPALSALVGSTVTNAAAPASAAGRAPTLNDFAATAGQVDSADLTPYRTLRPRTDSLSYNAVYNRVLDNGVSATVNGSLSYDQSQSLQGLARTDLTLLATNPFSPFAEDVILRRYLPDLGAMEQWNRSLNAHGGFTLDGSMKSWRWNLTGNYDHDESRTSTDRNPRVDDIQALLNAADPLFNPFGGLPTGSFQKDRAGSTSDTINTQLVMNGALKRLPAGDLSTTVKLGAEGAWVDSWSRRNGVESSADLSRGSANAQVSLDVPITSRKNDFLAKAGDLSANLNLAVNQLSDFGTLTNIGYGLNWSPVRPVSFIVSMTNQENAPSMSALGGAQVTTPDVQVFDYVRGESVQVIRLSGGNPELRAEERKVLKVGFTLKPPVVEGLSINANYVRSRTDNPISSFPSATAATEAAFPDRFFRDTPEDGQTIGRLIRIDARSVNFARRESDQLRWGFNLSRQIGKAPPRPSPEEMQRWRDRQGGEGRRGRDGAGQQAQASTPGQARAAQDGAQPPGMELLQGAMRQRGGQGGGQGGAQPGEQRPADAPAPAADAPRPGGEQGAPSGGPGGDFGGGRGGPGGGFGGGFGGRGPGGFGGGPPPGFGAARLQLALFHTVRLRDRIYITDGGPPLDLLDGDALGNGGGSPRHEIEAQAGLTKNGMGARLTASWRSATEVNGGATSPNGALKFSDLTTVNLRLFANLGARRDLVAKYPVLRGTRVTFGVTNLFDEKQEVRNAAGVVPVTYQEDYLDPLGRSLRLSVRKVFF